MDLDDLDPPGPTLASIRVDEEDPIRDHLARELNASTSFAAGAVALFWPLLFLWVLLRRWWGRGEGVRRLIAPRAVLDPPPPGPYDRLTR